MAAMQYGLKPPLIGNIADYLLERVADPAFASKVYIKGPDGLSVTFGELVARVNRTANALKSLGVVPKQRVLFSVLDGIDFPATFIGSMKIGAVAIPINTYLKPHDYRYFINDSEARVVIVDVSLAPIIAELRNELPQVKHFIVTHGKANWFLSMDDTLRGASDQAESYPSTPDEMAFWMYSSGSTGTPKGVVHTSAHLYWAAELFGIGAVGMTQNDVILSPPKMYFAFGLGNQVYFPIRTGAQIVINQGLITPQVMLEQWIKHHPTIVFGVPTLFAGVMKLAEESNRIDALRAAVTRLRICISGGEVLPATLMDRWKETFGVEILDGVGTTEMTHMFLLNRPGHAVAGSCGKLVDGFHADIVDNDNNSVPLGEIGNLRVFGPTAAAEYWNKPEKTAQVMGGGGVLTGDKSFKDEHGNFFFVGRSDDMLRVGGIWVSPAEVESVLAEHPQVMECAVVGHLDENEMIKPKAYIIPRTAVIDEEKTKEELRNFVRTRLAHIKCPRWFVFVDELPKTSTGKIQRFRLRAANT